MISEFDIEELVRGMFSLDDEDDIDYAIENRYDGEVSFECFAKIIDDLLPLVVMGESPLTKKVYRGFGKDGLFFIKQEVND